MKQKLLSAMFAMTCVTSLSFAQTREVSGLVTASDGTPISGASISVVGTNTATQTDGSGRFKITANSGASLNVSYIGYTTQRVSVGNSTTLTIVLEGGDQSLEEVVITGAYGVKQSARSLTSSAQFIDAKAINTTRQPNLNNALAGKVAGLQVRSQSAAALGRQNTIRLRGTTGFGNGNDGAIYVVDGTILPNYDDISVDEIESLTVLQGPAASAQFGSQGANGAIVITTIKGKRQQGFGINVNLGTNFDKAYIMPNYQNSYAGGGSQSMYQYNWKEGDPEEWKALDGKYYHDYNDDSSWGPRMIGQEYIPWYAWYGGHDRSYKTASLNPQPNNAKEFFETGVVSNNNIVLNKADENYNLKFSYTNQYTNGLLPTTSMKRNLFTINGSFDISEKLTVGANLNYVNHKLFGEIDDAYSNNSTGAFSQWFHRDLDMGIIKELRGLTTPEGIFASWNHSNPTAYRPENPRGFYAANYWYNPYTYYDLVDRVNQRDRLYGDLFLTYKINTDLSLTGTYRKQQNHTLWEYKYSSRLNESGLQTTGNNALAKGYYGTGNTYSNRQNIEFRASYNKQLQDFTINANAIADFFRANSNENSGATADGLNVPDLFTLSNSISQASQTNSRSREGYNAVMGIFNVGYKNLLFVDGTLRSDWYSTLPADDNQVFSKSLGAAFVFSDLIKESAPWLSLGKVKYSWGEVPRALGTSNTSFGPYRYPGMAYGVGQFKWGNNFLMTTPDQLVDPAIQGSVSAQQDIGLELFFLNNRIGLNATYWTGKDKNYPYSVSQNGATGYTSLLTNIGQISKSGLDIQLKAIPVRNTNFEWNTSLTWSRLLSNDVDAITEDTKRINVEGVWGSTMPILAHVEGQRWGQIYGNGIKRNDAGIPILDANGFYTNNPNVSFGSVLPMYTGGFQNNFRYKDFSLGIDLDFQYGGKMVSLSNMWGSYSGLTARTARLNDKGNPIRDAVADGGGVRVDGVDADNNTVTHYLEAQDYYHGLYDKLAFDEFIYDLSFIKMRALSFGYNIPVNRLNLGSTIKSANFSLVANNPLLIWATTKDFDPSEISASVGETGQLPGTRGFGFNLNIRF
ncbi:SusC/RagA family TonB-linked outer membrane protein [Sphingobacterium cavernae]|uniref:SusC/RagA family TonB-linked outer membrane protein n=1 Tax=Sphingobacterium cavernae TaxID=2592657 RepID=UPI00122FD98C|nr:SusC/RagA family TonB-linked outer membrane protein [Sphingobacterium cavernae]